MRAWIQKMGIGLQNFMRGRYGSDSLSIFLNILSLTLLLINVYTGSLVLLITGTALMVWWLFRCFSRNIEKRRRELEIFRKITAIPRGFFKKIKLSITDKQNKYFLCRCGTVLRVPKGRGKIEVHCPRCGKNRIRRS